jgi:acetyl-CoA carboxylase carboxyl transferase subunit alpha
VVDRILGRGGRDGSGPGGERKTASPSGERTIPKPTIPVARVSGPSRETDQTAAVWARVQLARNLRRPRTLELLRTIADEFVELHGDRLYGDDPAMVAGLARIAGRRVVVIGQQKGAETEENIKRNFGMPHPEGYRKAMRLMELAERLRMPVVTFIDVPGAHPGPESEERGIAEAIARSVALMSRLRTPIVAVITGEGGSGGALAIAVGDVVIALENAVYSVISPEGCASILWRTTDQAATAAVAMKMTAADQAALGVVDLIVQEPPGGAQEDPEATAATLKAAIVAQLERLEAQPLDELIEARYRRYRSLGPYATITTAEVPPPERPGLADRLRNLIGAPRIGGGSPGSAPGRPGDVPPVREEG